MSRERQPGRIRPTVAIVSQHWVDSGLFYLKADVGSDGGDRVVNLADFGVLAGLWLGGT